MAVKMLHQRIRCHSDPVPCLWQSAVQQPLGQFGDGHFQAATIILNYRDSPEHTSNLSYRAIDTPRQAPAPRLVGRRAAESTEIEEVKLLTAR
jgi:hypothetical protein